MNNFVNFNQSSKILVVGTSGSGKSTLARILSEKLAIPDIELDALFWKPNWTQSEPEEFRIKISAAMAQSSGFVIHGNYNKVRDLTWGHSNILIWLDYSLSVVMYRVIKRSILRILKNEKLWAGNKESFKKTFLSKDSIILWSWNTYELRKKQYEEFIQNPDFKSLQVIRLKNPSESDKLIASILRNN